MRGPSPKPGAINRAKPTHEWVNLPVSGNPNPVPPMPARNDDDVWSVHAIAKWQELWESPESLMWNDAGSFDAAHTYIRLIEQLDEGRITSVFLSGMKDCQKALGLTTPAKMQLRWRIVPDALADERFKPGGDGRIDARPLAAVESIDGHKKHAKYHYTTENMVKQTPPPDPRRKHISYEA